MPPPGRRAPRRQAADAVPSLLSALAQRPCQCHNGALGGCAHDVAAGLAKQLGLVGRAPTNLLDAAGAAHVASRQNEVLGITAEKVSGARRLRESQRAALGQTTWRPASVSTRPQRTTRADLRRPRSLPPPPAVPTTPLQLLGAAQSIHCVACRARVAEAVHSRASFTVRLRPSPLRPRLWLRQIQRGSFAGCSWQAVANAKPPRTCAHPNPTPSSLPTLSSMLRRSTARSLWRSPP